MLYPLLWEAIILHPLPSLIQQLMPLAWSPWRMRLIMAWIKPFIRVLRLRLPEGYTVDDSFFFLVNEITTSAIAVPEPSTYALLLGASLLALTVIRKYYLQWSDTKKAYEKSHSYHTIAFCFFSKSYADLGGWILRYPIPIDYTLLTRR